MPASPSSVALLFRGAPDLDGSAALERSRLGAIAQALAEAEFTVLPVPYADERAEAVRNQLLRANAVLGWVDPITEGQERTVLDEVLTAVATSGVLVSAHPRTILKMGTKEVLYETRSLRWGADTYLYGSLEEFWQVFPTRLASSGPRVLKQYRGNGGDGVWKVELVDAADMSTAPGNPSAALNVQVRAQHAQPRDTASEEMPLRTLMSRFERYFAAGGGTGRLIDQPFQPRIFEGMVRCYLVKDAVVGFARQYAAGRSPGEREAGVPPPRLDRILGLPGAKTMYGPDEPAYQALRHSMESEWVAGMLRLLDLSRDDLPLLWDADFLFGPPSADGTDSYVLGEINVSCVRPFPDQAPARLAQALRASLAGQHSLA